MNHPTIYLDFAAATPVDPKVIQAMEPFWMERFHNPSALYLAARDVRNTVNDARSRVARLLGAKPGEIIFTAGATEANNLAVKGIIGTFPDASIAISSLEHDSIVQPASRLKHTIITVNDQGIVNPSSLWDSINDETVLVSVMYANNEIGTIQPIKDVSAHIQERRADRKARGVELPLYLHCDAAQAANYLDINVARLGVDLMTLSAAKTYGPKQMGCLYIRAGVQLKPILEGGGQEFGLRSGTETVAGIIGLAICLEQAQAMRHDEGARLSFLRDKAIAVLLDAGVAQQINGSQKHRLPNNINLVLPRIDGERAVMMLDERGIQAATGAACGASKDEPSASLLAIGLSKAEAERSLRLTMGRSTSQEDMEQVVEVIKEALQ